MFYPFWTRWVHWISDRNCYYLDTVIFASSLRCVADPVEAKKPEKRVKEGHNVCESSQSSNKNERALIIARKDKDDVGGSLLRTWRQRVSSLLVRFCGLHFKTENRIHFLDQSVASPLNLPGT
jgi:hypothetical protein